MRVRWLRTASESVRSHIAYIAADNPEAARRVGFQIKEAVTKLTAFPNSGRIGRVPGTREVVLPNLPYLIVYRTTGDAVEILRLIHTSSNWPASHLGEELRRLRNKGN